MDVPLRLEFDRCANFIVCLKLGCPRAAVDNAWPDRKFACHFVSTQVDTTGNGKLTVRGTVEEAALFGGCLRLDSSVSTTAGSNSLEISDTITNESDTPGEVQILYHTNFGPPLLGEGSRIFAAIEQLAPYDEHSGNSSKEWDKCGGPTSWLYPAVLFCKTGRRSPRASDDTFLQSSWRFRGATHFRYGAASLLDVVEKLRGRTRWLCDRYRAWDKLPQSQVFGTSMRSRSSTRTRRKYANLGSVVIF